MRHLQVEYNPFELNLDIDTARLHRMDAKQIDDAEASRSKEMDDRRLRNFKTLIEERHGSNAFDNISVLRFKVSRTELCV